jgi:hypothetical protein
MLSPIRLRTLGLPLASNLVALSAYPFPTSFVRAFHALIHRPFLQTRLEHEHDYLKDYPQRSLDLDIVVWGSAFFWVDFSQSDQCIFSMANALNDHQILGCQP